MNWKENNTIYVAHNRLSWNENLKGASTFTLDDSLILTKTGCTRTKWSLPEFMRNIELSYRKKLSFKKDYFQSVARGKEFVFEEHELIKNWVKDLINHNMNI